MTRAPWILALVLLSSPGNSSAGDLPVAVHLPPGAIGNVQAILCSSLPQFLDQESPAAQAEALSAETSASLTFTNVSAGSYALKAYLDLNGNRELDRDPLGRPREPWAMSNGIRAKPSRTSWEQAVFSFPGSSIPPTPLQSLCLEP